MGCHARRLDLTCRLFQDHVVEIKSSCYDVEIKLPEDDETPENVRPGYCRAYAYHFEAGGLSFPLPRFLLEVLEEIKMAFTQMAPNFFRYFLGCWVRAQEEGLEFGLGELKQRLPWHDDSCSSRWRGIIEGIPNKDDRWREKFFVFKINLTEFLLSIEPFGSAPMSPELRGLMETLRRGNTRWLSFTPDQIRAACALPPGANRATHVALVAPIWPKRGGSTKRKKEKEGLLDRPDESYEAGEFLLSIEPFGSAPLSPELPGLMETLRRERSGHQKEEGDEGLLDRPDESSEAGSLERARKVQRGRVLRPRSQAQSPGLLARPVSVAIPSGGAREAPDTSASSAGDRALNDEIDSSSHRSRRWVLEEINSVTSGLSSPRLSPLLRASGEGTSWVNPGVLPSSVPEAFLWSFAYDSEIPILENPDSLAAIWCKAMEASNDYAALMEGRFANFPSKEEIAGHLLTIQQLRGELDAAREAERQRKVEIEKLKKKLAAAEAERVVVQSDLDSMKEKYRREIEGRDRNARKDLHLARVFLAKEYEGVLAVVKGKLEQKKKETAAEILLHETRARIEALTEYSEGGFELEAELERLKDLEVSLDVDYGLASVSDPYLGRLDLPEIPGDSVNQD
ncbi:hypothetical protein F2Q69_00005377 [Brassica cretica]|uniref:Uncharacterized protein n=1 Tax=Brassica cretica TaxID=69181 RepID=A0A8S9PM91_BRACR|nr:hypothetical protein F2Q69_00005377 [Brassica cretica]